MKIIASVKQMQGLALKVKRAGRSIGLVPTMGALHEGHFSLIRRARKENDVVVVSVFVNPAQFGPNEDYLRYPRPAAEDAAACRREKADYLFMPSPDEMYPGGHLTFVTVERMSDILCGESRPGHFRGVATVVSKLFNIARPDRAYFGMKDYQQLTLIKRMASDLNFPVAIVPCPIVREPSGLALSSRNAYLSPLEKERGLIISRSLQRTCDLIQCKKIKTSEKIEENMIAALSRVPGARLDYVAVLDPETLEPVSRLRLPVVIAVAIWMGRTRLIDNIIVGTDARSRRAKRRAPCSVRDI